MLLVPLYLLSVVEAFYRHHSSTYYHSSAYCYHSYPLLCIACYCGEIWNGWWTAEKRYIRTPFYFVATEARLKIINQEHITAASTKMGEGGDDEDYGALIYRESQLRKAEAAAAAAEKDSEKNKKTSSVDVSSTRRRATSTRASSAARSRSSLNGAQIRESSMRKRKVPVGRGSRIRKKYRYECTADGCNNKVVKGGVCIKHGAKHKRCNSDGCTNIAKRGGVCKKHGAKVEHKRCSAKGCTSFAQQGGVCIRHGAKVEQKRCCVEGCTNFAQKGGVCMKHGAKRKLCSSEGCTNNAQKGGVCVKHGAKVEYKRCSSDGCTSFAQKGGVCIKHGATKEYKRCCVEGCTNQSKRGGVCRRHGAYRNPHDESTAFTSCFGSEFDKTTLTHPNQRTPTASASQYSVPEEVAVCVVIAENLVEV